MPTIDFKKLTLLSCVWLAWSTIAFAVEYPATVRSGPLPVRSAPESTAPVIATLPEGSPVQVLEEVITAATPQQPAAERWSRIRLDSPEKRWVSSRYIDPQRQVVTADRLNVRSGPGTTFNSVGQLKKGDPIRPITRSGEWVEIESSSRHGFVPRRTVIPVVDSTPSVPPRRTAEPAPQTAPQLPRVRPEALRYREIPPYATGVPPGQPPPSDTAAAPPPGFFESVTPQPAQARSAQPTSSSPTQVRTEPSDPAYSSQPVRRTAEGWIIVSGPDTPTTLPEGSAPPQQPTSPPPSTSSPSSPEPTPGPTPTRAPKRFVLLSETLKPHRAEPAPITDVEPSQPLVVSRSRQAPIPERATRINPPSQPRIIYHDTPRIVTRDGVIRLAYEPISPAAYELWSHRGEGLIHFLVADENAGVDLKEWLGKRVLVTGEEGIDTRATRYPIIKVSDVRLLR